MTTSDVKSSATRADSRVPFPPTDNNPKNSKKVNASVPTNF